MTKRIAEFDLWRPGYGGAVVNIYQAGTTTAADIYTDEDLTVAADNPQTLSSMLGPDGVRYGKFSAPLYTAQAYELSINGIEQTGINRPSFSSLSGEDASDSNVIRTGSSYPIALDDLSAQRVDVATFGVFTAGSGGVAATNTATIELAIAALSNGGDVLVPAGTFKVNSFSVPEGIVIRGYGREATVLQSILGDVSFTLTGDRAGFKDITLDGSSLSSGSIAVKSVGKDEIIFENVMIRRFETGAHILGGKGFVWKDFSIENTATGIKLHGDTDSGDTTNGDALEDVIWNGGLVSVATTIGVSLSYEDAICHNITLAGVGFESCTGTAFDVNGAHNWQLIGCWFDGNTKNANIQDDSASLTGSNIGNNIVKSGILRGGRMDGGEFEVTGSIRNVVLENMKLDDVDFTLTTSLDNFLVLRDCIEDSDVTISGETTKLIRETTSNRGASYGLTTDGSATAAWTITLEAGEIVYLEAKVIGRQRNAEGKAIYHITAGAYKEGDELAYDNQTANFTLGATLTGATSGATGRIVADADGGTTGTLTLIDVVGEFENNETIADDNGTPGSALANGTLSGQNATLDSNGVEANHTAFETDVNWACVFAATGNDIELRVTGASSKTVEWTAYVEVISNLR